ncbi:MAG TPA: tRNA preQ1(34) S-adenosylmethionine ribosyltransferase-isomerase QueA [Chloroflexota bacterium]|nr:tRNA preQ1(34) S-adenosylmethionine ribosyltransferase-isomerase QueA [Chloroflexota bacterium]
MTEYATDAYDYDLPSELIAQQPIEPRDAARLMVVDRASGRIEHRVFRELPDLLRPGDLLVANRSRVIPARLHGRRLPTGGAAELLLLRARGGGAWEALVRPARPLQVGGRIGFGGRDVFAEVVEVGEAGGRVVRFVDADGRPVEGAAFDRWLAETGEMPLPPYIKARLADPERYQTVYAGEPGSAAAPTAGLHFTPELLFRLRDRGIPIVHVTLHVGLDTFRPVEVEDLREHRIHSEWCQLTAETAARIAATRQRGGRVVAVGTTAVRVLETSGGEPYEGDTRLFIYPGYRFRVVDALVTNFHLPRSSLLMLVSAFAGRDLIRCAYEVAVEQRYRFFSFGDAMLFL